MKLQRDPVNKKECFMSLIPKDTNYVKLAIQVSKKSLYFIYSDYSLKTGRVRTTEFQNVKLYDGKWHTVILTLASNRVGLQIDCGKIKIKPIRRKFPAYLNTMESNFHIGNCNNRKTLLKVNIGLFLFIMTFAVPWFVFTFRQNYTKSSTIEFWTKN